MSSRYPFALSILAHGNPNAEVIGLDQFPKEETPPLVDPLLFRFNGYNWSINGSSFSCLLAWNETRHGLS